MVLIYMTNTNIMQDLERKSVSSDFAYSKNPFRICKKQKQLFKFSIWNKKKNL